MKLSCCIILFGADAELIVTWRRDWKISQISEQTSIIKIWLGTPSVPYTGRPRPPFGFAEPVSALVISELVLESTHTHTQRRTGVVVGEGHLAVGREGNAVESERAGHRDRSAALQAAHEGTAAAPERRGGGGGGGCGQTMSQRAERRRWRKEKRRMRDGGENDESDSRNKWHLISRENRRSSGLTFASRNTRRWNVNKLTSGRDSNAIKLRALHAHNLCYCAVDCETKIRSQ